MIIKMQAIHIDEVMGIWLNENISAHNFVPQDYWYSKFDEVKIAILKAVKYMFI